jgi:hypothetical protein
MTIEKRQFGCRALVENQLRPANVVVIAVSSDRRLQVGRIGARRRRLAHREARSNGAIEERVEPALALFRRRAKLKNFHVPAVRGIAVEDLRRPGNPPGHLGKRRIFEISQSCARLILAQARQEQIPKAKRAPSV